MSRVRCRCGGPEAAPVLSRLPVVVFLSSSSSFFFFYRGSDSNGSREP